MKRITMQDLEAVVSRLNKLCRTPEVPWTRDKNGKFKANIGNYHLSGAYGGWTLHQMDNESGGVEVPIRCGYVSKRELYNLLQAFINGIENQRRAK